MMISVYNSDGEITKIYDLDDGDTADTPVGGGYVEGVYDADDYYVLAGTATARPTLTDESEFTIAADGTDEVVIALPDGTEVYDYDDDSIVTSSGSESFTFRSTISGVFRFTLTPPFPYVVADFEVTTDADS